MIICGELKSEFSQIKGTITVQAVIFDTMSNEIQNLNYNTQDKCEELPPQVIKYINDLVGDKREDSGISAFISSTQKDLRDERRAIKILLERMGVRPIWMEDFYPQSTSSLNVCLAKVNNADIYLGVLGGRYGSRFTNNENSDDPRNGCSFTELEYNHAVNKKKQILGFMLRIDEQDLLSESQEDQASMNRFKQRILDNYHCSLNLSDIFDLLSMVSKSVHNAVNEILSKRYIQSEEGLITISGGGLYYPNRPIYISGKCPQCDESHIYLYLVKASVKNIETFESGQIPDKCEFCNMQRYGESYLKIPLTEDHAWKIAWHIEELTDIVQPGEYLLIFSSPKIESYSISKNCDKQKLRIGEPFFSGTLQKSIIVQNDKPLKIIGTLVTPQPFAHLWIFGNNKCIVYSKICVNDDDSYQKVIDEQLKSFTPNETYFCVVHAPLLTRNGGIKYISTSDGPSIVKLDDEEKISEVLRIDSSNGVDIAEKFIDFLPECDNMHIKLTFRYDMPKVYDVSNTFMDHKLTICGFTNISSGKDPLLFELTPKSIRSTFSEIIHTTRSPKMNGIICVERGADGNNTWQVSIDMKNKKCNRYELTIMQHTTGLILHKGEVIIK